MDILTHALSGTAVASCTSAFIKTTPLKRAKILFVGTLGGAFPDIDAISMWSRFDSTIGNLFSLSHKGREIYGMKLWYSHHAFFHSLLASLLFGVLLVVFISLLKKTTRSRRNNPSSSFSIQPLMVYFITFVLAYWAHLAGDLPTPSSVWGGIALFWPSNVYVGGYGDIWWWNNYDVFLLILCSIILILLIPVFSKNIRKNAPLFSVFVLSATLMLIIMQMNNRTYKYNYKRDSSGYAKMEENSKKEQERILGKRLYRYMSWLDSKIPLHF